MWSRPAERPVPARTHSSPPSTGSSTHCRRHVSTCRRDCGSTACSPSAEPASSHYARLALQQGLALRSGDRALLRRPGSHEPAIGLRVADVNPAPFVRRGDAGVRAEALAMTPTPTADDIVDWHGVLARDTL